MRVQDALDRRQDPLVDPVLAGWLEAHPDEIECYAALLGALRAIARPAARARRWPWWLGVAAAAAAVVMGWWLWPAAPVTVDLRPAEELGIRVVRLQVAVAGNHDSELTLLEWERGRVRTQTTQVSPSRAGDATVHRLQVAFEVPADSEER